MTIHLAVLKQKAYQIHMWLAQVGYHYLINKCFPFDLNIQVYITLIMVACQ